MREHKLEQRAYDYPPALWSAFVSALRRCFAPTISTVRAEEPSAESFDGFLPRHPFAPCGERTWRLYCVSLLSLTPNFRVVGSQGPCVVPPISAHESIVRLPIRNAKIFGDRVCLGKLPIVRVSDVSPQHVANMALIMRLLVSEMSMVANSSKPAFQRISVSA
jgi:hypothetical protein